MHMLVWTLLRREPNLVALKSVHKADDVCIMVLVQVPYVALYQSLAVLSPAIIFRTIYLLMTLKSKSLADNLFF